MTPAVKSVGLTPSCLRAAVIGASMDCGALQRPIDCNFNHVTTHRVVRLPGQP